MNFPSELKYTKEHSWLRVENDEAVVGITDFAQTELGEIVFVDVDTVGKEISKDEVYGTIEAVKTVSDLFMPVAATVLSINENVQLDPLLVNSDPYGKGWLIRIRLSEPSDINNLLSVEEYNSLVSQ